jgi:hypothetical protein
MTIYIPEGNVLIRPSEEQREHAIMTYVAKQMIDDIENLATFFTNELVHKCKSRHVEIDPNTVWIEYHKGSDFYLRGNGYQVLVCGIEKDTSDEYWEVSA